MKHKLFVFLFVFALLCLALMAFAGPVQAAPGMASADAPVDVLNVVIKVALGFASLVGVSQLTAALVNLIKYTGLIRDGTSAKWAAGINLLLFLALVIFGVFRPQLAMDILDGYAGQIAMVILFILGFLVQITGTKTAYDALSQAKVPLIGKSFSNDA